MKLTEIKQLKDERSESELIKDIEVELKDMGYDIKTGSVRADHSLEHYQRYGDRREHILFYINDFDISDVIVQMEADDVPDDDQMEYINKNADIPEFDHLDAIASEYGMRIEGFWWNQHDVDPNSIDIGFIWDRDFKKD